MSKLAAILVNYNYTPEWLQDYDFDVTIYDRSDDTVERDLTKYGRVYKTKNMGDVDYDKLSYIIENYDTLPDVFLWGKTNIFKFCPKDEFDVLIQNRTFTPILTKTHRIYMDLHGPVNGYQGDIYTERADSWFFNSSDVYSKYFNNWQEWCVHFGLPRTQFIPFAPGGNYILTKEKVHKYSRDFYEEMRAFLPHSYRPAEAQCAERSYYLMWK